MFSCSVIGYEKINPYREYDAPYDRELETFEELLASDLVIDWLDAFLIAYELATRIEGYPVTGRQRENGWVLGQFYLDGARDELARQMLAWLKEHRPQRDELSNGYYGHIGMLERVAALSPSAA